jgi:hypothetical protein
VLSLTGQWTSQDSYGLGTSTLPADKINAKYDPFRVYETGYRRLRPGLFAGLVIHCSAHTNVRPGEGTAHEVRQQSPCVLSSEENGSPMDRQISPAPA